MSNGLLNLSSSKLINVKIIIQEQLLEKAKHPDQNLLVMMLVLDLCAATTLSRFIFVLYHLIKQKTTPR